MCGTRRSCTPPAAIRHCAGRESRTRSRDGDLESDTADGEDMSRTANMAKSGGDAERCCSWNGAFIPAAIILPLGTWLSLYVGVCPETLRYKHGLRFACIDTHNALDRGSVAGAGRVRFGVRARRGAHDRRPLGTSAP